MIGKLLNHQGIVADQVKVTIARDYRRVDQPDGWRGEAWLSTDTHILPGDRLSLELKDGAAVPILVERVTVDSKAGQMLIRFTGSGSLDVAGGDSGL
jgi:hypothetical protein